MMKEFEYYCKNSLIEQEFIKKLKDKNIKIVSFDIFNTLAFRKVSSPSGVFSLVGKNKYVKNLFSSKQSFMYFRKNAEKITREKYNKFEDIKFDWIYEELIENKKDREYIKQLEIDIENETLYINKQVEIWLTLAYEYGKKVVLTSDIYFSLEEIEKLILSKLKNRDLISNVFLSSEYLKSKKKLGLYQVVKEKLDLEFSQILHIGDNNYSDISNAQKLGIKTIEYNIENKQKENFLIEKNYINQDLKKLVSIRNISLMLNPFKENSEKFFFSLAVTIYAPIIWEFSRWLNKFVSKKNINQVNFIMREGKVFKKYFEFHCLKDIETQLIYGSRKSTYLPSLSLENNTLEKLLFLEDREFTIKDIYNLYKIPNDEENLKKYENITSLESKKIYVQEELLWDILVEDFTSKFTLIEQNIKKQKDIFSKYLKSFNLKEDSILFDFGGRGTILKRISKVLNQKIKYNTLFYSYDKTFTNTYPIVPFSFFKSNSKNKDAIRLLKRSPEFTEILFNGFERTTLGYELLNKEIKVIKKEFILSDDQKKSLDAFYYGLDTFFSLCKEYNFEKVAKKTILPQILSRCIDVPSIDESYYLGSLITDEGKGSSFTTKLISKSSQDLVKEIGISNFYYEFMKNKSYNRKKVHWPQGVITSIDSDYLSMIKGLKENYINTSHILNIVDILRRDSNIKKVNIYGVGIFYNHLKSYLKDLNIEVILLIDSKANEKTFNHDGKEVFAIKEALIKQTNHPIIIASIKYEYDIIGLIRQEKVPVITIGAESGFSKISY